MKTLTGAVVPPPQLQARDGATITLDVGRWLRDPGPEEEAVLDRALAPALDVGCGPGRHVVALGRRGIMALGVDVTPDAVGLARRRGALVLQRSVFDRMPGSGRWGSVLLLDGNVGIGGDPAALLRRVATLLAPGGRALVEVAGPGRPTRPVEVRLHTEAGSGPWFRWAEVGIDGVGALAGGAGLAVAEVWHEEDRWFARLDRPALGETDGRPGRATAGRDATPGWSWVAVRGDRL
jgi:SAM-dependent methyltransferase